MADTQRILVTVKTYPTLSRSCGQAACTLGVRDDGRWVRIYPIPLRRLDEPAPYQRYDWLQCRLLRSESDPRPETFHPADADALTVAGHLDTRDEWRERRRLLLRPGHVYERLEVLFEASRADRLSLAVFKPSRVLDFLWEAEAPKWDPGRVRELREQTGQRELFADDAWRETFRVIPRLPYNFSYVSEDAAGRRAILQLLDWEVAALYWSEVRAAAGDESAALGAVRARYLQAPASTDLHFVVGTTHPAEPGVAEAWAIMGMLALPLPRQLALF